MIVDGGYAVSDALLPFIAQRIADGMKVVIRCERCMELCVGEKAVCRCCSVYGTKMGGGTIYYPDDGRGHHKLMAAEEFARRYLDAA